MSEFNGLDLNALVEHLQPNVITPQIGTVVEASTNQKPRVIAQMIIKSKMDSLTNPPTKDIVHNGKIHKIKFFDADALNSGNWAMVSLMLLHLSYGEQVMIIDTIYPEKLRLTAKAFAANFTVGSTSPTITIENDTELIDKLDSTNAGIAMVIAMLKSIGGQVTHADKILFEQSNMEAFARDAKEQAQYMQSYNRAQSAAKYQDRQR